MRAYEQSKCKCGRIKLRRAVLCRQCWMRDGILGRKGAARTRPLIGNFRIDDVTGCWNWTGNLNNKGYGMMTYQGKMRLLHRLMMHLYRGLNLEDSSIKVLHRCDNPRCINLKHLFVGTQLENMGDMSAKGRHWCSRKTHCKHGHAFSPENTRVWNGYRQCIACHQRVAKEWADNHRRLW